VPQKLEVMCQLVSSLFDLNPNISSYMKVRTGLGFCRSGLRGNHAQPCASQQSSWQQHHPLG
jgi:hypothetical protein